MIPLILVIIPPILDHLLTSLKGVVVAHAMIDAYGQRLFNHNNFLRRLVEALSSTILADHPVLANRGPGGFRNGSRVKSNVHSCFDLPCLIVANERSLDKWESLAVSVEPQIGGVSFFLEIVIGHMPEFFWISAGFQSLDIHLLDFQRGSVRIL